MILNLHDHATVTALTRAPRDTAAGTRFFSSLAATVSSAFTTGSALAGRPRFAASSSLTSISASTPATPPFPVLRWGSGQSSILRWGSTAGLFDTADQACRFFDAK